MTITYEEIRDLVDEGKTPSQIKVALDALTREEVYSTPRVVGDITEALPEAEALLVLGTIKQVAAQDPRIDSAWIAMSTVGVQLHSQERQGMIDTLATVGSWPDAVRDTIKKMGTKTFPVYPGGVEVADIQTAIDEEATRVADEATAESIRIQTGYLSVATQAAQSALPGTKAEVIAAFTDSLNANWSE